MSKTIDFPDLDAAIDAEAWQWLQEAAPVYADAVTAEVKRGHEPGDIRRRFMRLTQRHALGLEARASRPALAAATTGGGAMTAQDRRHPLEPFGKARPRVTRTGHAYMPDSYTAARDALRLMFGAVTVAPPWALHVTAVRAMPASWSKRRRGEMAGTWCASKPDADNIAGAVMDALFEDDAAVVEVACRKVWGPSPELRIEVRTAEAAA
jgi:Holliday junction resolvase RusA-like endonuclease